ncbi:MAG: hypothetical protein ACLFR1_02965 [Spirochaetia bacterium]
MAGTIDNSKNVAKQIQALRQEIEQLDSPTRSTRRITETANRLKLMSYDPQPDISNDVFLLLTKPEVLARIDEINKTKSGEEALELIRLLVNNYKFLEQLRKNDISAWDKIEELYGED